jgi:hypothetical protein
MRRIIPAVEALDAADDELHAAVIRLKDLGKCCPDSVRTAAKLD